MYIEILETLEAVLNFTSDIHMPENAIYGSEQEDGSWNGIVGAIHDKQADLGLSDLSVTERRSQAIDFSTGIYSVSSKLFMKLPKRSVSWTTFSGVFDYEFLILLAIEMIAMSILFFAIFYLLNHESTIGPGTSIETVFFSHVGLGIFVNPHRLPGRILVLTVCASGTLIFYYWNAGLVSLLTTDIFYFPIKSLKVQSNLLHIVLTPQK